jgi:hypothetical protein
MADRLPSVVQNYLSPLRLYAVAYSGIIRSYEYNWILTTTSTYYFGIAEVKWCVSLGVLKLAELSVK